MLFTGTTGLYAAQAGTIDETGELFPPEHSERIARLWRAEQAVLEAGGCVVRLAGLYHAHRGPHAFFFEKGEVARRPDSILNLIHYEDAASIAVAVRAPQLPCFVVHASRYTFGHQLLSRSLPSYCAQRNIPGCAWCEREACATMCLAVLSHRSRHTDTERLWFRWDAPGRSLCWL
jgi:hypothetical protein